MPSGGSRAQSGPAKDPSSERSKRAGFKPTALPNQGHDGPPPPFPLMSFVVRRWEFEDKRRFQVTDQEATDAFAEREQDLWDWAWATPQAAAWARESWRWLAVAMWVRTSVVCESSDATAADKNALHRFGDQIGLTPAGMAQNGWAIAHDEVAERAAAVQEPAAAVAPVRRLRGVPSGG